MKTNPGKAAWALRKAEALEAQVAALVPATDWRGRVRNARTADWLRAEAARFRAMAMRWSEPEAA